MPQIKQYPFSAIVGQETMRLALILNAINPAIGGVLIRGQKGTAKSTAARALASLLPPLTDTTLAIEMRGATETSLIEYEQANNQPGFVELPIGASDDRVTGTLNIERALQSGTRHFEPGLLAQAHQGILYVDEVNLLADHIVDVLLDAAASGVNTVERDGISVSHAAQFILIGTMNPEEGELRPQLLDRFGLAVDIVSERDPQQRAEVVRRRIAFEADSVSFVANYAAEEETLAQRIDQAKAMLLDVRLSDEMLQLITYVCAESEVEGLRADITLYKTAQTLAAWEGRTEATVADVRRSAEMVLLHRRRRQPFEEPGVDQQQLDDLIEQYSPPQQNREPQSAGDQPEGE